MASVKTVERQIGELEGFDVVIRHRSGRDARSDGTGIPRVRPHNARLPNRREVEVPAERTGVHPVPPHVGKLPDTRSRHRTLRGGSQLDLHPEGDLVRGHEVGGASAGCAEGAIV